MWIIAWSSNWIIAVSNIIKTHVKVNIICMTIEIYSLPNNCTEYNNNMVKIILGHLVWSEWELSDQDPNKYLNIHNWNLT